MRIRVPIEIREPNERRSPFTEFWKPKDSAIERVVALHIIVLARKRFQLLTKDEYGKYHKKKWEEELSHFISDVLIPAMSWTHPLRAKSPSSRHLVKAAQIVDRLVADECERLHGNLSDRVIPTDGVGYELFCQRELEGNGWKVQGTKRSGDQGVDLIGHYGNRSVAFQCKRYSQPVGNKAVQEVVAGRQYYQADLAAIITNASYTEAAQSLAIATGVILLHHADLPELGARIAKRAAK